MVFGFGFNKAKVLAAAEKYVQQGKLQNAISEYEKIIKADAKDLTVLNTIGDLLARVGKTDRAVEYFRLVGDAYASEGFTVKAIAMYKKLTKLSPSSIDCVKKLAELYVQQGLYNDARAQYLLVTDYHVRLGENDQAARTLQRMLELDPNNVGMQGRLADLYIRMGKKKEAKDIFLTAAQSLYSKMAMDEADAALAKVLNLDPENADALLLRGQIAVDNGDGASASQYLEAIPNLDSRADALRTLVRAHLAVGNLQGAGSVAEKLLNVHGDLTGIRYYADALLSYGNHEEALRIFDRHADKFLSSDPVSLTTSLKNSIGKVKESPTALDLLRSLFEKAGETTHSTEVMELLAHAWVQCGELEKARDLYYQLAELEPQNSTHMQVYRQIVAKLGQDPAARELTKEEGAQAFMVEELEQRAEHIAQEFPEEITAAVNAALTDSELFSSYNIPAKAIAPLEAVYSKAPRHAELNQRLASLYARAERFADAARCCNTLSEIYDTAGLTRDAEQYASLATKYLEKAKDAPAAAMGAAAGAESTSMSDLEAAFAAFGGEATPPPMASAAADMAVERAVVPPPAPVEFEVPAAEPAPAASEWDEMVDVEHAPAASLQNLNELMEEIRFYLSQKMYDEADSALTKAEHFSAGNVELKQLRAELAAARAAAPETEAVVVEELEPTEALVVDMEVATAPPEIQVEPERAAMEMVAEAAPAAEPEPAKKDSFADFAMDLESSLGDDFPTAPPPTPEPLTAPAAVMSAPAPAAEAEAPAEVATASQSEGTAMLSDLFEEFKDDVEEDVATDTQDPETHYNLGIAFKEMGLLDEAIGELQKVCQAIDKGQKFSQAMQAYTWLAQCLVDKGVPQAAIRWYERALTSTGMTTDSRLSLHYDLANAHEAAGDKKSALTHFLEVYSTNIDFRDVADRIKALKS